MMTCRNPFQPQFPDFLGLGEVVESCAPVTLFGGFGGAEEIPSEAPGGAGRSESRIPGSPCPGGREGTAGTAGPRGWRGGSSARQRGAGSFRSPGDVL